MPHVLDLETFDVKAIANDWEDSREAEKAQEIIWEKFFALNQYEQLIIVAETIDVGFGNHKTYGHELMTELGEDSSVLKKLTNASLDEALSEYIEHPSIGHTLTIVAQRYYSRGCDFLDSAYDLDFDEEKMFDQGALSNHQPIDQAIRDAYNSPTGVEYHGGTDHRPAFVLAGMWALEAQCESGHGVTASAIEAHLETVPNLKDEDRVLAKEYAMALAIVFKPEVLELNKDLEADASMGM